MRRRVTEHAGSFAVPRGAIAMQDDGAIGQPRDVAGESLHGDVELELAQELTAETVRLEVDERGGADVEGEAAATEESGATSDLAVTFDDDGREAARLQPRGGGETGDSGTQDGDVVAVAHGTLHGVTPACAKKGSSRRDSAASRCVGTDG